MHPEPTLIGADLQNALNVLHFTNKKLYRIAGQLRIGSLNIRTSADNMWCQQSTPLSPTRICLNCYCAFAFLGWWLVSVIIFTVAISKTPPVQKPLKTFTRCFGFANLISFVTSTYPYLRVCNYGSVHENHMSQGSASGQFGMEVIVASRQRVLQMSSTGIRLVLSVPLNVFENTTRARDETRANL